jgi:ElaB/YqjD/DUF883 family membrane-anchored ribosome-binding protein
MSGYQTGDDGSLAAHAQEKVQQTAHEASNATARYVREQTETRGKQVSEELQNVSAALRRSSHALHADGNTSSARGIELLTERMDALGRYLGGTGGDQMLRDLEMFGRRKPWGMIGVGLGVGLAASRFLKASSSRRIQQADPWQARQPAYQSQPSERVTGEIPVVASRVG